MKNEGECRASVAFASVAVVETCLFRATGTPVSLSEQQLLDCAFGFQVDSIQYTGTLKVEHFLKCRSLRAKCPVGEFIINFLQVYTRTVLCVICGFPLVGRCNLPEEKAPS